MSWRKKGGPDELIVAVDIVDGTDGCRGSVGICGRRSALMEGLWSEAVDIRLSGADDNYVKVNSRAKRRRPYAWRKRCDYRQKSGKHWQWRHNCPTRLFTVPDELSQHAIKIEAPSLRIY